MDKRTEAAHSTLENIAVHTQYIEKKARQGSLHTGYSSKPIEQESGPRAAQRRARYRDRMAANGVRELGNKAEQKHSG